MSITSMNTEDTPMDYGYSYQSNSRDDKILNGPVQIDLSAYASNYSGYIKYKRLLFIAQRCPSLRPKALCLLHDYIKQSTLNINAYDNIFEIMACRDVLDDQDQIYNQLSHSDPGEQSDSIENSNINDIENIRLGKNEANLVYDAAWVQTTGSKVTRLREVLETELKNSKANAIKEYIRKCSVELGDLYLSMGQLGNTLKYYTRSRDYCMSRQQDLAMSLNIIKVAIYQNAWSHVSTHVALAGSICDSQEKEGGNNLTPLGATSSTTADIEASTTTSAGESRPGSRKTSDAIAGNTLSSGSLKNAASHQARTQLAIAGGLEKLATFKYREAANFFLQAHCDQDDSPVYTMVTPSDLAFYVTLCALASFNRNEIKARVLSSPSFRLILESEGSCRDILTSFYQANYAECLGALSTGRVRDLLRLDLFLADHVTCLLQKIRVRALCQYFTPYITADLNMMARAFTTSVADLENELADLIQKGSIKARIDSNKQLLCALNIDQRCSTFASVLQVVDECQRRSQAAILRSNLARYGYNLQHPIHDDLMSISPASRTGTA